MSQESKSGPPKYEAALVITLKPSKLNGNNGPKFIVLQIVAKKTGFSEFRTVLSEGCYWQC
jgi:hypothetical protein